MKVPYVRVRIAVEKVYVDDQHPQKEGKPSNIALSGQVYVAQTLGHLNNALKELGLSEVTDETGTSPKLPTS